MKKQILLAIAIIAFLNVWTTTNVSAQSAQVIKVKIDFAFQAKGASFPAGEYYIESISRASNSILSFRSADGSKNQMIIANQLYVGKAQPGKFVFERRGENYFLTGIVLEGSQWGFSLPISRRKSEKNLAAVEPKIVELPISKD